MPFSCYLERTTNLEPKCSLSFLRAASTFSLSSKLAMASPDGLPSLLRITLTDKHFASGKKNSFISFSVALKGNPDIFRLNSLSNLELLLEKVAGAVSNVKFMYLSQIEKNLKNKLDGGFYLELILTMTSTIKVNIGPPPFRIVVVTTHVGIWPLSLRCLLLTFRSYPAYLWIVIS